MAEAHVDEVVSSSRGEGHGPIIGVAPRWEVQEPSLRIPEHLAPSESMISVFADAIIDAGGVPLMLPLTHDEGLISHLVDICDGFAIPGGPDVDPRRFGDESPYDQSLLCPERDGFEFPLVERVLQADKPLFTTCRGTQLLNVVLGGTLCMDVPGLKPREGMALWRHAMVLTDPAHPVEVREGTLLSSIVRSPLIQVNSSHHCCVGKLGEGAVLSGESTDGVPECIELPDKRFVLGVQWHPEYTWRSLASDRALWHAFVEAAR
ncbi:MAG: gamma-glutamyl-gamma-aminobutyrate hydrolase family protein [Olsenella sp.]|nr:gamma-glutamyl-gamma-aminobutyrate hydrolase family protein [Olsenella sp.]